MNIGLLVALSAFQGVVVAFNQPARLALVPSLVSQADLASAVAINSVVFNLARFIGPMFAGLAIVWFGVAAAFAANALSYVVFLVALCAHSCRFDGRRVRQAKKLSADLRDGLRYTATHPGIAALLVLLIALGVGGRPLNELLPGFAADVFRSGAGGLSILASAIGGGAILGGLWLGHRAHSSGLTFVVLGGALTGALAAIMRYRDREHCGLPCRPLWFSGFACPRRGSRSRRSFNSPPTPPCAVASWVSMASFSVARRPWALSARACIGAVRASMAGFLGRAPRDRGRGLDLSQPQTHRLGAAGQRPGCRRMKQGNT